MSRLTKNKKAVQGKYDVDKHYTIEEASKIVKEISTTKFDASVDLDIRLGVDAKKADELIIKHKSIRSAIDNYSNE